MSTPITEDLTEQGIAAFKRGDKRRAVELLYKATKANPTNQRAWLWLAGSVSNTEGRRTCLQHVVEIAPTSPLAQQAREALDQLTVAPAAHVRSAPVVRPAPPAPAILDRPQTTFTLPRATSMPLASRLTSAHAETRSFMTTPQALPASTSTTIVATPQTVSLVRPSMEATMPAEVLVDQMRRGIAAPAAQGKPRLWINIAGIITCCAALGWVIGSGWLPEIWAIAIVSSVALFGMPSGIIHHSKGRSALLGFLIGSGLSLIGLLIVALGKPDQRLVEAEQLAVEAEQLAARELRRCPSCGELVHYEARVCRFCQHDLPAEPGPNARQGQGRSALIAGTAAALIMLLLSLYLGALA